MMENKENWNTIWKHSLSKKSSSTTSLELQSNTLGKFRYLEVKELTLSQNDLDMLWLDPENNLLGEHQTELPEDLSDFVRREKRLDYFVGWLMMRGLILLDNVKHLEK